MVMRIPEGGGAGTRGGAASRMSTRAKKAETKKLIKADKTKPVAQQPPKKNVKVKPAANPPKLDVVQKLRLKPSRPVGIPLGTKLGEWPAKTVKINSAPKPKTSPKKK
jgi:hypothetical protein